jgi:hypothetical protein
MRATAELLLLGRREMEKAQAENARAILEAYQQAAASARDDPAAHTSPSTTASWPARSVPIGVIRVRS